MQLISVVLAPEIGLTLANYDDGQGWRFANWYRHGRSIDSVQPSEEERARGFASAEEAEQFFRQRYAARLTESAP